jgi:hypothetical protein
LWQELILKIDNKVCAALDSGCYYVLINYKMAHTTVHSGSGMVICLLTFPFTLKMMADMDNHHYHRQNCPFGAIAFRIRFCHIAYGFHFFGFCNNNLFYRVQSSALHPTPNLEDQVSVFMSSSVRVAQLYPQALGPILSPSTTRRAMVEVF